MKKGDVVSIYQDPITQTKLEGKATLIKRHKHGLFSERVLGLERWLVRFEDGDEVWRDIKTEETMP